ncbi:hypothetical protein [Actinokineospora spheciospongiae]|uniref:hypothetical protein n=1 Tax=Actinokineospora spheciospongiae TaxID=909613 RepID=UPI000D70CFED|nr:hypothetical protein [Actinokineospora spheciospongiae]PWW66925.1 hypothetical protein DFQ13_101443 [Actinokineospora spheciospongiae]
MATSPLDHRGWSAAETAGATPGDRRRVHFVGSLPPALSETDRAGMRWLLDHTAPAQLTTLPCDRDPRWIIEWLEGLRDRGPLELVLDGDSSDYTRMPVYRVRRGATLHPGDVGPRRAQEVPAAIAARRGLGVAHLPPHQVSMPAPLDLSLFAFGVPSAVMRLLPPAAALRAIRGAIKHLPTFTAAITAEVEQVQRLADRQDEHVVIQLESPAVMVAYDRVPRAVWPLVTALLTRQLAGVIAALPPQTSLILHGWCHGDLAHKPIADTRDLSPLVDFANNLAARLDRLGRPMPPVHVALCDGETAPSTEPSDYQVLRRLRGDIRLFAGLVDEHHPEASARALELVEQVLGRPVDAVAAACGLGRRTPREAEANAALAARLSTAPVLVVR